MNIKNDKEYWDNVRLRNLKINIVKKLIDNSMPNNNSYSESDLKDFFAFKEYDINFLIQGIFEKKDGNYYFNSSFIDFFDKVKKCNKAVKDQLPEAEAFFISTFGVFQDEMERTSYLMSNKLFPAIFKKLKSSIQIIHWGKLPIFNKHLLFNRRENPENDTLEFYNHPDCLNALLKEVRGDGLVLSNESDLSLNKDIEFNIYNRRWGHPDFYKIRRTITGWKFTCLFAHNNGECDKDGTYYSDDISNIHDELYDLSGPLFESLEHDSVFFPKEAVQYALKKLWEEADEGIINYEDLTKRVQEIADWISAVERVVGETQPNWVNYY